MLVLPAYAKINLALSIVGRRADGWHDIDTVLAPVDWHDLVGVTVRRTESTRVTLGVGGPAAAGVPVGTDNLAARAAAELPVLADSPLSVAVWLSKTVPHGAGLGGGSADAAAVLRAGIRLLGASGIVVDSARVADAALALGSDVPALLPGGAHRVLGRGERVAAIQVAPLDIVIASTLPSSTPATYAALGGEVLRDDGRAARLAAAFAAGEPLDESLLGSALEPAARRANPALGDALDRARAVTLDARWHLTGSGGALFAIVATPRHGRILASTMSNAGFAARACRTVG